MCGLETSKTEGLTKIIIPSPFENKNGLDRKQIHPKNQDE
jgi:hypothetical protein